MGTHVHEKLTHARYKLVLPFRLDRWRTHTRTHVQICIELVLFILLKRGRESNPRVPNTKCLLMGKGIWVEKRIGWMECLHQILVGLYSAKHLKPLLPNVKGVLLFRLVRFRIFSRFFLARFHCFLPCFLRFLLVFHGFYGYSFLFNFLFLFWFEFCSNLIFCSKSNFVSILEGYF
jgi:hypothetical protein